MSMVYDAFHGTSPFNYAMKKLMAMDVVINIKFWSAIKIINTHVCLGINGHYSPINFNKLMIK